MRFSGLAAGALVASLLSVVAASCTKSDKRPTEPTAAPATSEPMTGAPGPVAPVACAKHEDCASGSYCRRSACEACPAHIDCMPPVEEACPPPGLTERCPGTMITH